MSCRCLRRIFDCFSGESYISHTRLREIPSVAWDTNSIGNDVVIVKNGSRVCGTGGALASAPIVQSKAYFEMKVQQTGVWGVGLATNSIDLNRLPLGEITTTTDQSAEPPPDVWILRNDSKVYHNSHLEANSSRPIDEGDVIGVSYDHVDLTFFVNGEELCTCTGAKGTFYPAVYVDDGAIIDAQFVQLSHQPPSGFQPLMIEQTLL